MHRRRERTSGRWAAFALLLALFPASATTEEPEAGERAPVEVVTEEMSAEEMARRLYPTEAPAVRTRGIRITDEPETPQTLGLPIRFGLNSAEIASASRSRLDEVGRMLQMEVLRERRLRIEGHTDASGSASYNRRLSLRRAQSVAHYLVEQHGIDAKRLVTGGRGEEVPLTGRDPHDPMNRRVEFSAAGP